MEHWCSFDFSSILDKAKDRCEAAEVYSENEEKVSVRFASSKLKSVKTSFSFGFGLRVIREGKIGFSSANSLNSPDKVLNSALSSAQFGPEANFAMPTKVPPTSLQLFDEQIIKLSPEKMINIGREALENIKSFSSKIYGDVEITKSIKEVKINNSEGLEAKYNKTTYSFFINTLQTQPAGLLQVYDGIYLSRISFEHNKLLERIKEKIEWAKNESYPGNTRLPIIFTPPSLIHLLEPLKLGINGKMAQKGTSPLINRVGEKIFKDHISIFDDATLNGAPRSFPFDDEGVGAEKTVIIEDGVFKNFILDLQTAGHLKKRSTGNGLRNFYQQPTPSPTTLVIKEGDVDFQDMLKNLKCGILVEQIIGWASNPLAGEFAGNIELGYWVENGEIRGRVKDTMISGNIYECFQQVEAIGNKSELVWGMICAPPILMTGFTISGKG